MAGKAMVVGGATGAIGSVCARLLAKAVDEIYMVAPPEAAKLLALRESIELETPGGHRSRLCHHGSGSFRNGYGGHRYVRGGR